MKAVMIIRIQGCGGIFDAKVFYGLPYMRTRDYIKANIGNEGIAVLNELGYKVEITFDERNHSLRLHKAWSIEGEQIMDNDRLVEVLREIHNYAWLNQ